MRDHAWQQPMLLALSDPSTGHVVTELKTQKRIKAVFDELDLAFSELFDIAFPAKKDNKIASEVAAFKQEMTGGQPDNYGYWVFYPWSGSLVRFPAKEDLRLLKTARNRNLVTHEEQQKLFDATVLIAGMSVGSNIVEALISQGIGGKFILIDMDVIEPTNLNRIRAKYR